ncbi:hypothetical protein KP509_28G022000 [Ceratopteris richardii]|nr:hypothetical protein KP509_28G022000 [Ceratopteris richardii]
MATPEYNWKVGHEKVDKNGEDSMNLLKSKQDRDKGDPEQEYKARNREDLRFDARMDGRGKKRSERDPDFNIRYNKQHIDEVGNGKLQDDKDTSEKQSTDLSSSLHNQYKNGKQCEDSLKYRKVHDGNCRERDSWSLGGRVDREKVKDGGKRHTRYRDASHGRWWGGTMRDERTKDSKDVYDRQQHLREMEERQRYSVFDVSKQRQEKGTKERMLSEKSKGERHEDIPIPVFERLGSIKEKNRFSDEGDTEITHVSSDKGYHQFGKKYKDHDRQTKSKFCWDSNRESANYGTAKGDPRVSKASRSASLQEQEPIPISESKELCAAENLSKRSPDSNMFEAAVPADNDFLRTRARHVDEILHETSGRKSKFGSSLSTSSGARHSQVKCSHAMNHGEQGKSVGPDEQGRSWESNVVDHDSDDERWRSHDHEKIGGNSSPRRPQDWGHCDFARTSESPLPNDSTISKRKYEGFSQSSLGPFKHVRMEGCLTEKPEWSHHSHQGNHIPPDIHMGRSLSLNHYVGSTTLLPPFRSGLDNSSIIDTSGDLIGVSNSRDVGRYDRKVGGSFRRPEIVGPNDTWVGFGMGYSHNQGPVAAHGGLFPSFPQTGLGFLGIGPHLHGPQVFEPDGVRPMSMGFGSRFRMGDGFSSFSSHAAADYAPALGWQRYSDGHNSYRPLSGFMHGWEGPRFYRDEHQSFNHSDWDQFSHGITGGWDGVSEPWKSQSGETACDDARIFCQKEGLYQARTEDYALHESDTRKVQVMYDNISETPEFTHALTTCIPDSFVSKASKRFKERLKELLQHAKIHRTLIDTEIYKEYLSFLPTAEVGNRETFVDDHMDISSIFVDEDLEYEGDSDAQDLLSNVTPSPSIFPSLSFKRYEEALRVFQRSSEKDRIQKSKFGSFLLPQCISGIVTSNSNSKSRQGVHRNIQNQTHASSLTVGSTLDPGSVRLVQSRLVERI